MVFQTKTTVDSLVSGLILNSEDAATSNRVLINDLLERLSAAGGGTILLPAGDIYVNGTGTGSQGAILMQSNTSLRGQGMGVTNIILPAAFKETVTGIIRTPSGEITTNVNISGLTIDGNKSNQTTVTITNLVQVAGTATATVGLLANLPAVGDNIYVKGANQDDYNGDVTVLSRNTGTLTFTYSVDVAAVSPATGTITFQWAQDGFYCGVTPGSTDEDNNINLYQVEVMDCTRYGFDPHEQTRSMLFFKCRAHGNGTDGFVADYIEDGIWIDCESYSNLRHGFNITTKSSNCKFYGCEGYLNADNGFITQRGSTVGNEPRSISLSDCDFYENLKEGVRIRSSFDITINGGSIRLNERDGINISGSKRVSVDGVNFINNGQASNNAYSDVLIDEDSNGNESTNNVIGKNNTYLADEANKVEYHVSEEDATTVNNNISIGSASGAVKSNVLTVGATTKVDYGYSPLGILSTTTGIDAKSATTTNLFTVPIGRTAIVTGAVIRCTAASAITVAATAGIGVAAGEDDIFAPVVLTGLTSSTSAFNFVNQLLLVQVAAAGVIKLGIDVAATGTSQVFAVDLIGYLI